ncbi:MAG: response regulator [Burkholderiales bacterium]|jgi:two-component system OmpR family response regulator/two-component system response regulator QseB|nr:response regulator [Burkholderiales bacterium]
MRVLLVEDDTSLGDTISEWLKMDGYAVDWVTRGDLADTALLTHTYDCVLLDRGLPKLSGDAVLKKMRDRKSTTPVLFITARDAVSDRIAGLDAGADDYLIKPFDLDELSARIRAALRRHHQNPDAMLSYGGIKINPKTKQVWQNETPITTTAKEFAVLYALMLAQGRPQSRAQLEETLYGWGEEIGSNAVEVYIHHLRRKLGADRIVTVRPSGYVIAP